MSYTQTQEANSQVQNGRAVEKVFRPLHITAIGGAGCAVAMALRARAADQFGCIPPSLRFTFIEYESDPPAIPEELEPRFSPRALREAGLRDSDQCLLSSEADMKALAQRMADHDPALEWLHTYCMPEVLALHGQGKEALQEPSVARFRVARAAAGYDASCNWITRFGEHLDALSRYGPALQETAHQFGHAALSLRNPVLNLTLVGADGGTGGGGAILTAAFQRQEAAHHAVAVEFHLHMLSGYRGVSASSDRQRALAVALIKDVNQAMDPMCRIRLPREPLAEPIDWRGPLFDFVQLYESSGFLIGNFAESVWAAADALLARYFSPGVQLAKDWDNATNTARERQLPILEPTTEDEQ